ncbi:MAG: hypothetical protein PHF60_04640 [Candidatus ainarchaeum sp.]|nr:hypothetical protein [Candidatus ainarchaeum sp.]
MIRELKMPEMQKHAEGGWPESTGKMARMPKMIRGIEAATRMPRCLKASLGS